MAKIRVSQGYCYVVQCTLSAYLTLSGFPIFLIEEKNKMPELYIILYTLFQFQAYPLNLIPLSEYSARLDNHIGIEFTTQLELTSFKYHLDRL